MRAIKSEFIRLWSMTETYLAILPVAILSLVFSVINIGVINAILTGNLGSQDLDPSLAITAITHRLFTSIIILLALFMVSLSGIFKHLLPPVHDALPLIGGKSERYKHVFHGFSNPAIRFGGPNCPTINRASLPLNWRTERGDQRFCRIRVSGLPVINAGKPGIAQRAWIAGVSLNRYDSEIIKLVMPGRVVNALVTHLLLALMWLAGTLLLLAVFDMAGLKELSGWPVGICLVEVVLLSLLGCAIGLAFKSGIFSVSFLVLYSLLMAPAIYRLVPATTMRGIAPRLSELSRGQHVAVPLLFDVAYFVALVAVFLGIYLLRSKLHLGNREGRQK